ncbi:unnamed protein product, partial [marine sediment metagenome]
AQPLRNKYDFDLYLSIVNLMQHNAKLILGLGELEHLIGQARDIHFASRPRALGHLRQAVRQARSLVEEREKVYADLVRVWEKSRLPKGLSTAKKAFVHRRDRGPHFANRTADMRYLIIDEELLDLEGWADSLEALANDYETLLEC